jgi:predicted TPR repeat methyltransferase
MTVVDKKTGRNDLCPCGSGKKFKQCCLQPSKSFSGRLDVKLSKPDVSNLIQAAIAHHQEGNLIQAETIYHEVLAIDPNNFNALHLLGITALHFEKYEQAAEFSSQAIACNANFSSAHFSLGNAYQALKKLDSAAACFRQAISLDPSYVCAHNNLGVAYKDQNLSREATACFLKAISLKYDFVEAHNNLGNVLKDINRQEEAIACFHKALSFNPDYAEAHYNLGVVLKEQGKLDEAVACFHKAIALKPDFAEAHSNLGVVFMERGKLYAALLCYRKAILLKPDFVEALNNLGNVLRVQGKLDKSLACFQQVIKIEPENGMANHSIAVLSGSNPERAPSEYIEKIFNAHADKFDSHLLEDLQYETPEKLVDFIRQSSELPLQNLDILDLGCGTGLVGLVIAPYARQMVGVDLSAKMLEKAQARNLYQRLERADLLTMMQGEMASSYDLIIAADVFVYLGKLDTIFNEAIRLLRPGGIFAFSVKAMEELPREENEQDNPMEYRLNETGRYAHSSAYLSRLAVASDFKSHQMIRAHTRLEKGQSVQAWLVLCVK